MSGPTDPFIPFVPGPANPNVPGSLTHTLLNFNFGTKVSSVDVGFSIAGLDSNQHLPLANVPPLTSGNLTDFHSAASGAAPVQTVAGLVGNITTSQLAAVLPAAQAGTPKGLYDATANSPTLTAAGGGGVVGDTYTVSVAGTPSFDSLPALPIGSRIQCVNISSGVNRWVAILTPQGAGSFTMIGVGQSSIHDVTPAGWLLADPSGFVALSADANGIKAAAADIPVFTSSFTSPAGSSSGDMTFAGSTAYDFGIADAAGYLIFTQQAGVAVTSATASGGGTQGSFSNTEIAQRNNRNLAYSQGVASQVDTTSARPIWGYSHIIAYGQSLSTGQEGWPALSTSQKYDNLMFGGATRPQGNVAPNFVPVTGAALNALIATNQTNDTSGTLLSPSQVAVLPATDDSLGEDVVVCATNFFRKMQLNMRGLPSDANRRLVASSCGVGGRTIESLSKGASPELFNRLRDAANGVKTIATAASKTYGVGAILFLQGEYNYTNAQGGTTDPVQYLADLVQLKHDIALDLGTTIAAQLSAPAMFTYQTGAQWTADTISIGMAQLNAALTVDGFYMASSTYPVTDKGGHLDANGYRWLGAQFGKVMHKVLNLGQKWLPMYPTAITVRGLNILVDFHVPAPPIVFDLPWAGSKAGSGSLGQAAVTNQGFNVNDSSGAVPISSVQIVSDTSLLITVGRALASAPMLVYGDMTHQTGNGGVRDSDPTIADDLYTYNAGSGQYPDDNQASLVNKPYALWNWLVAFNMPIVAG